MKSQTTPATTTTTIEEPSEPAFFLQTVDTIESVYDETTNLTTTTITPATGTGGTRPIDASYRLIQNPPFSTVRNAAIGSAFPTAQDMEVAVSNGHEKIRIGRGLVHFDTSSIAGDDIVSATLSFSAAYTQDTEQTAYSYLALTGANPGSHTSANGADYSTFDDTILSDQLAVDTITDDDTYHTFTLNAEGLAYIKKHGVTSLFFRIGRGLVHFDTSSIAGDDIVSATLSFSAAYTQDTEQTAYSYLALTGANPGSHTSANGADYSTFDDTILSDQLAVDTITDDDTYHTFTLNAEGLAYIKKHGVTSLFFRIGNDIENTPITSTVVSEGTSVNINTSESTTNIPTLTIVHAPEGGQPPVSTTETFTTFPGVNGTEPIDTVYRKLQDAGFSTLRNAETASAFATAGDMEVTVSRGGSLSRFGRGLVHFDTSTIGDKYIESATLSFSAYYKLDSVQDAHSYLALTGANPASHTTVNGLDYSSFEDIILSNKLFVSDITTDNSYHNFTLNEDGIAYIKENGVTSLFLRIGHDIENVAIPLTEQGFGTAVNINTADSGANPPILTITLTESTPQEPEPVDPMNSTTTPFTTNIETTTQTIATTYTYDTMGRLETMTDPEGEVVSYTYDALGNRETMTDEEGHTTTYQYDEASNQTTTILPSQKKQTRRYDTLGRLKEIEENNGDITTTNVYQNGRLHSTENGRNNITTYGYDNAHRLTSETNPQQTVMTYQYDARGNQRFVSITDANNTNTRTTEYQYDTLGRQKQIIHPTTR